MCSGLINRFSGVRASPVESSGCTEDDDRDGGDGEWEIDLN